MADTSETSGSECGSYFDGCLLNTMEILVKDIEKRSGEKLKEPYIVYMIETRFKFMIIYFPACAIKNHTITSPRPRVVGIVMRNIALPRIIA